MRALVNSEVETIIEAIETAIDELGLLEIEYDNGWHSEGKQALIEALRIMGIERDNAGDSDDSEEHY